MRGRAIQWLAFLLVVIGLPYLLLTRGCGVNNPVQASSDPLDDEIKQLQEEVNDKKAESQKLTRKGKLEKENSLLDQKIQQQKNPPKQEPKTPEAPSLPSPSAPEPKSPAQPQPPQPAKQDSIEHLFENVQGAIAQASARVTQPKEAYNLIGDKSVTEKADKEAQIIVIDNAIKDRIEALSLCNQMAFKARISNLAIDEYVERQANRDAEVNRREIARLQKIRAGISSQ